MITKAGAEVGNRIKRIREAKLMTATELAKRAGVSHVAVWTWEHKGITPRLATLDAVANALGVTRDYLLNVKSAKRRELLKTTTTQNSRTFSSRSLAPPERDIERLPLEALMRAIDAKGFKVLVEPKKKIA